VLFPPTKSRWQKAYEISIALGTFVVKSDFHFTVQFYIKMKIIAVILFGIIGAIAVTNKIEEYEASRIVVYERRSQPTSNWENIGTPDRDEMVSFTLALKQRRLAELEAAFWANSNPKSPMFAKHWTREQVLDLISPPKEVHAAILSWINQYRVNLGVSRFGIHTRCRFDRSTVNSTCYH
jgi:hypothetical protein